MTAWSTSDIPDQTDRVAVVTGANSGIGFETTRALAEAGATVIMACRDLERGERAKTALLGRSSNPDPDGLLAARVPVLGLDVADPASIRSFVDRVENRFGRLNLLVNNAGVMATPPALTEAGVERQWATNHLGPFVLTGLLLPLLTASKARVIAVSSLAAAGGDLSNPVPTNLDDYSRFGVYSNTKLANQVFAMELNHRLASAGSQAVSLAAHPGISHTNLAATVGLPFGTRALLLLSRLTTQSAAAGALPILRAATDPAAEGGQYYGPSGRNQRRGPPKQIPLVAGAAKRSVGRRLWARSMEVSGVRYLCGD